MTDATYSPDNDALFLEKSRSKLKILEDIRLEKLKVFLRRKKLAIPLAAILTPIFGFIDYWLLLLQRGNDGDSAAGVTAVVLVMLWRWVNKPKREYARAYKTEILPDIAGLFGDFTYDMKGKIPMDLMKPSKVIPYHSAYKSEDCFTGTYRGVGIKFSEIKLTKNRNKSTVTVFRGLAIVLTHGVRKFQGHTILLKDQGAVSEWAKKQISGLKRANMVDLQFERMFDVFTNDQTEARYLIDPVIIENLKSLYHDYNGTELRAAFYDEQVLLLIGSDKNHFEPAKIETAATNETELLTMKREISQILSIVDQLSLYDPASRRMAQRAS